MALQSTDNIIVERDDIVYKSSLREIREFNAPGGIGVINPNPTFVLGDTDYENYVNGNTRKVVTDVVDNAAGSLYVRGYGSSLLGSNFIPVDVSKRYRASISVLGKVSGVDIDPTKTYEVLTYLGVACYDSDKHLILPQYITEREGTQTFLAADLNNGDTNVTIVDGSNWANTTSTASSAKSILIHRNMGDGTYRYTGENGRLYDDLAYSRYMDYAAYTTGGITDNGDGTWNIALTDPWNLGSFVVGDAIRNSYSGGTYNYWLYHYMPINTGEWYRASSLWRTPDLNPHLHADVFRNGVAFCKLLVLPNYRVIEDGVIMDWNTTDMTLEAWYSKLALEWDYE